MFLAFLPPMFLTLMATVLVVASSHIATTPLASQQYVHPVPQYAGFPETVAVPAPPLPCKPPSAAQRAALAPAHPAADASPQQEMLRRHRMVAKRGCGCCCCCCKPCCCCCCKPCCCCCCKPCCCCNCCNCCCCCHKCMCICVRPSCCCKCCPTCCGCPGYGCGCRRRRRRALSAPLGYPMPMFLQQIRASTNEPGLCREICQVRVLSERSHSIGEMHTNVNLISADDRQRMAASMAARDEKL